MKKAKFLIVLVVMAIVSGAAQAQVTPQAVIANAPGLPAPEQWAANGGHTDAFKAKLSELSGKLAEMQSAAMRAALEAASKQSQTPQQQEQMRRQQQKEARQGMAEAAAMGITEADMKRMQNMSEKEIEAFMRQKVSASPEMQVLASMGITQADMDKMGKMNEKQAEAYMKKRLADNGFTEADFRNRMEQAGVKLMSEAEMKEADRREREAQAKGEAMAAAQQAQAAYMDQMQVTSRKIGEAEKSAVERVNALWERSKGAIEKANEYLAELGGPEEIMRGTITKEQYESRARRVQSLYDDYNAAAYHIWHEFIVAAQGRLKFLMPYAQAWDDTQTGGTAAASVAEQYLQITASEPENKTF